MEQTIWYIMIKTENEIKEIGIQVMNDIEWTYDDEKPISIIQTTKEEQYERFKTFKGFEENKHKIYDYWKLIFNFPKTDAWAHREIMILSIRDDNGEPFEIQHHQYRGKIFKNEDGKYYLEEKN